MADHAKKTKASVKEHSNGQREHKSKGPKQTGSPLATQGDVAKKKSDKKSSNKKHALGLEASDLFRKLQKSWPEDMPRLFDPSLAEDRRVELWQVMCEGGESLRRRFGWAIPDERALRILEHFGPIVEIGSGLGYWAMLLRSRGVDVNAYDKVGGKPIDKGAVGAEVSRGKRDRDGAKKEKDAPGKQKPNGQDAGEADSEDEEPPAFWTEVKEGGPEKLEDSCNEERALFLCYPDEFEGDDDDEDDDGAEDEDDDGLGLRCLHVFEGDVVIHVGELFGDSLCMSPGQSPWGRTTSRECQEELASRFHCVLKVPLPRWPHSRDTLTVWKRNEHVVVYYGSSDEDDEEEDEDDNDDEEEEEEKEGGGEKSSASKPAKKDRKRAASTLSEEAPSAKKSKGGEDSDGVAKVGSKIKGKEEKDMDKDEGKSSSSKGNEASEGKRRKKKKLHGAKDSDGDDEDEEDEDAMEDGEASDASDADSEILKSLMAGAGAAVPDCDMYAFIPDDEQLPCEQAAPGMQFLLEEGRGKQE